jgi:antitoxin (DNA-binding transcriptional repressor) of toxin-antitoxin stability system
MRRVGVREFKQRITAWLGAGETLVIERHGTPVGFYVPIEAKDRAAGAGSLERLDATVSRVMEKSGLSEDELVEELTGGRRRARR